MAATDDLLIGMAGAGGDGVISAGESLITAAALAGYHAILTKSFGPQIRGGESSFRLRVAAEDVFAVTGTLDIAIALNWDDFLRFGSELPVGAGTTMIFESEGGPVPDAISLAGVHSCDPVAAPITRLSKDAGSDKMKNPVVLGLLAEWLGVAPEALLGGVRRKFAKKGPAVLEANERAFAAGRRYAADHPLPAAKRLTSIDAPAVPKLLTDGNEMCGAAAIFAGCTFFGGYPITPSTEIMQYLGREIWQRGCGVPAEDEIAGVAAVVGASFAGKKAMTATSGPGMSLKTEVLGLASIAELPLVCVNVQRAGPSTGIPTKSEQADLFQAVFSAHGDVVRPVLAATDVRTCSPRRSKPSTSRKNIKHPSSCSPMPISARERKSSTYRHIRVPARRTAEANIAGAGEISALRHHGLGDQPTQRAWNARRQLSGIRHRA